MEAGFGAVILLSCVILTPAVPILTFGFLGWFLGSRERRRLALELTDRERRVAHLLIVNTPALGPGRNVALAIGSVVYAPDLAARNAHRWRRLVGGSAKSMQRRLESARRLATVRALEHAGQLGAGGVLNLRYQTSYLAQGSGRSRRRPLIEIIAYGTAWVPASR